MKKLILLALAMAFGVNAGFGQDGPSGGFGGSEGFGGSGGVGGSGGFRASPVRFRSTEWVGLSSGSAGNFGEIQTVNGIAKGPWFAGVGAGLDYYRFRSVPLFVSVTRDIAVGKRDWFFLYADGGTNLPWYKRPETPEYVYVKDLFQGGEYWSGGLGYVWKLGGHSDKAVVLSAGYTVKKLSEVETPPANGCPLYNYYLCPPTPPVEPTEVFEYLCRAYQFMIGFRF